MNSIFVLVPLSLVLLGFAVWAFFWAVRTKQFDNLDVEAWRILLEDDAAPPARSGNDDAGGSGQPASNELPAADRDDL